MVVRFGFIVRGIVAPVFLLSLAGPSLAETPRARVVSSKSAVRANTATERPATAELRRSLRQALGEPFPTSPAAIARQARELLSLYREAAESSLSASERSRWLARLRNRLAGLSKAIARGRAGGAARSNAQDLIELIESTIAPETWEVNGGRGTIMYWEPGLALVVRQTDDVHEQIGGVVRVLGN